MNYRLLITEEKLPAKIATRLFDAGFVVVTVKSAQSIRLLSAEQCGLPGDVMLAAALRSMATQSKETYGSKASVEFVKMLADAAEKALRAETTISDRPLKIEVAEPKS